MSKSIFVSLGTSRKRGLTVITNRFEDIECSLTCYRRFMDKKKREIRFIFDENNTIREISLIFFMKEVGMIQLIVIKKSI